MLEGLGGDRGLRGGVDGAQGVVGICRRHVGRNVGVRRELSRCDSEFVCWLSIVVYSRV